MKYNQPYDQASNTDAPYVNGNPSSGVQGSIIPAAAVEYPQRELVALIAAAGLSPDNADLKQVAKAIQSGKLNSAVAGGSASAMTATLNPVPTSLGLGFRATVKLSVALAPGATFNPNGLGAGPVKLMNGSDIRTGDTSAGQLIDLVWDGAVWQLQNPAGALVSGPTRVLTLTSTTTLTVQSGETRAEVQVWAGGGAGGGGSAVGYGGGGGGGEYRQGLITGLASGQTIVATVGTGGVGSIGGGGNGGSSSFGSYVTAVGGKGAPYSGTGAGGAGVGGSGGSGGSFSVSGMAGEGIFNTGSNSAAMIGLGGASWGSGHSHFVNFNFGNDVTGSPGLFPGQGGSGASGAGVAGSGANGLMIVKFYP